MYKQARKIKSATNVTFKKTYGYNMLSFNINLKILFIRLPLILSALLNSTSIFAQPTINWEKYNFPPYFIVDGPYAGIGIADKLFALIQKELPQYQHRNKVEAVPRIFRNLSQNELTCSSFTRKAGREKTMHFSNKAVLVPNLTLQLLTKDVLKLQLKIGSRLPSSISLDSLLTNNPDIKIGVKPNKSYGVAVDRILKKHKKQTIKFATEVNILHILNMIHKKRIDFFIEYPPVSSFALKSENASDALTSIGIKESRAQNTFTHIVCSKTPQGQSVIKAINDIISTHKKTIEYRSLVEKWLPKHTLTHYRKHYQQGMLEAHN